MKYAIIFLFVCCAQSLVAQPTEIDRSFLTIMVVPYTGPDEGVKSTIERSEMCRIVLGQINRVFETRNYRTKDYMAILRLRKNAPDIADLERSENIEAMKNARVDVMIYAEINFQEFSSGDKQLRLRLQAVDIYSAENYANHVHIESTRRRYSNFSQAARETQFVKQLEGFADQLDNKLVDILHNGRTVTIKVSMKPNSEVNLNTLLDNSEMDLNGKIEEWIRTRTLRIYSPSGAHNYWQAECKLPVLDEKMQSVTPFSFRSDFRKYLQQMHFSGKPLKVEDQTINSVIEVMLE